MQSFVFDVFANVVGDIISALLFAMMGLIVAAVVLLSPRRKLFAFFGIRREKPLLRVYVSTLKIVPGADEKTKRYICGAADFRGIVRSYDGLAIPEYEFLATEPLNRVFSSQLIANLPKALREWLEARFWVFHDVEPIMELSPMKEEELQFDNLILLGSGGYNLATQWYQDKYEPKIAFGNPMRINYGVDKGREISYRGSDMAVLEKIIDQEHETVVFISQGWNINGTRGALLFLVQYWDKLYDAYGEDEFALCIQFPHHRMDPEGYRKPRVVASVPQKPFISL